MMTSTAGECALHVAAAGLTQQVALRGQPGGFDQFWTTGRAPVEHLPAASFSGSFLDFGRIIVMN